MHTRGDGFLFSGQELEANGFCFCCSTGQFCSNSVIYFFIINVWRAVSAVCAHVGVLSTPSIWVVWECFHEEDTAELWPFCLFLGSANWSLCARMWWDQTAGAASLLPPTLPQTFCSLFFFRMCPVFALSLAALAHSSLSNSISPFIRGNRNVPGMSPYPSSLSNQFLIICPVLCSVPFFFLAGTN